MYIALGSKCRILFLGPSQKGLLFDLIIIFRFFFFFQKHVRDGPTSLKRIQEDIIFGKENTFKIVKNKLNSIIIPSTSSIHHSQGVYTFTFFFFLFLFFT